jgi:hypothetical protein
VQTLIDGNADVNKINEYSQSALDVATTQAIKDILTDAGAFD